MQVQDHIGIYQVPESLDCIKWSQDNLLAVAAGQSITIFNPAALGGPRAFAPFRTLDCSAIAPGFTPQEWRDSPQFAMSAFYEVNLKNPVNDQGWRGVAWSPMGCTISGGCLLAALSSDLKVRVFAPSVPSLGSTWREAADVTALLQRHMAATGWREVDCLAVGAGVAADDPLRLRGGRSRGPARREHPGGPSGCAAAMAATTATGAASEPAAAAPTAVDEGGGDGHGGGGSRVAAEAGGDAVLRLRGGGRTKRRAPEPGAGKGEAQDGADAVDAKRGEAEGEGGDQPQRPPPQQQQPEVKEEDSKPEETAAGAGEGEGASAGEQPPPAKRARRSDGAAAAEAGAAAAAAVGDGAAAEAAEGTARAASAPAAEATSAAAAAAAAPADGGAAAPATDDGPGEADGAAEADGAGDAAAEAAGAGRGRGGRGSRGLGRGAPAAGWRRLQGLNAGPVRCGVAGAGGGVAVQLREGDHVEVHNAEEGLTGGWFPARLLHLSAPQYGYGLVEYDELQVSEEAGSPKLTEWFPLPGCPRLLTPAAARTALSPRGAPGKGEPYPVHCRKGYALRPAPPSQLAICPVPPPLRLGLKLEVMHDAAWWAAQLVRVSGPAEAVAAAATRSGDGGAAGGSGGRSRSGVVLHVQLLDAEEQVEVPLERSRSAVSWNERTATWSSAGADNEALLAARTAPYRDVVLLSGGAAAAATLEQVFVQRVEALRAGAGPAGSGAVEALQSGGSRGRRGGGDDTGEGEEGQDDEGAEWAAAVDSAGHEMLRAFAPELRLLGLDAAWLWGAVRGAVAALQGASHPDQLPTPTWAPQPAPAPAAAAAAAAKGGGRGGRKSAAGEGAAVGSPRSGAKEKAKVKKEATAAEMEEEEEEEADEEDAEDGGAGAEGAGTSRGRRKSVAGRRGRSSAAAAASEVPLDFSNLDPATFHPYDTRPEKDEGGDSLDRAAVGMISKRFAALLSEADPASLREYAAKARWAGVELHLINRAYGEFMHLYGSKLKEGAGARIQRLARIRCRPLLKSSKAEELADGEKEGEQQQEEEEDGANVDAESEDGEGEAEGAGGPSCGPGAKRRRTMGDADAGGAGPAEAKVKVKEEPRTVAKPSTGKKGAAGGAARRGRSSVAEAGPSLERDYSGLDAATFLPYDTRPDPQEGGESLDKAGPGLVGGRWRALMAEVDPSECRMYAPGERLEGQELQSYERAYGEFIHLYGSKLPEGAARRIYVEAKRRIRVQLLRAGAATQSANALTPAAARDGTAPADADADAGGAADGAPPATTASGRRARAAALKAVAATRRQVGGGDDEEGDEEGGGAKRNGGGVGKAADRRRSAAGKGKAGRRRAVGVLEDEDDDDASDFSVGVEVGDSGGSSDESLGDDEEEEGVGSEEEEEGDGSVVDDEEEDGGSEGGGGRGRGRGGRGGFGDLGGGRGRGRKALRSSLHGANGGRKTVTKEEEQAAADQAQPAIAAATPDLFTALAPSANLDDPAVLHRQAASLVIKRFTALRNEYDPSLLHCYRRGEHLRGPDLRAFLQSYGEFLKVFGAKLPHGADKKLRLTVKSTIRRQVVPAVPAMVQGASEAADNKSMLMWAGKRRQGVREAAGMQGTLFMGYKEGGEGEGAALALPAPGAEEAAADQDLTASQGGGASSGGEGGGAGAAGAGGTRETWALTASCIGRRRATRYQVELKGWKTTAAAAAAATAATAAAAPPPLFAPSYCIRFKGVVRDDHRSASLQQCKAEVGIGPPVPTPAYEARSLALSATCLSWSPPFTTPNTNTNTTPTSGTAASPTGATATPATAAAAPKAAATTATTTAPAGEAAAAANGGSGGGPADGGAGGGAGGGLGAAGRADEGVCRSCVLAVGNRLGQVAMWRLDLPREYTTTTTTSSSQQQPQGQGEQGQGRQPGQKEPKSQAGQAPAGATSGGGGAGGSGTVPMQLHWMGALRAHSGGAHVLRTAWCVAPEAGAEARGAAQGGGQHPPKQGGEAGQEAEDAWRQWRVPQPHSAGLRDGLLLLTGLSDGSILLWAVPAASFRCAADLSLLAQICPADGLAPTSLDWTWLMIDAYGTQERQGGGAAAGAGQGQPQRPQQQQEEGGAAGAPGPTPMEVDAGCAEEKAGDVVAGEAGGSSGGDGGGADLLEEEGGAWGSEPPVAGPSGRRLLVACAKPCGAVFVWRSGPWRPGTVGVGAGPGMGQHSAAGASATAAAGLVGPGAAGAGEGEGGVAGGGAGGSGSPQAAGLGAAEGAEALPTTTTAGASEGSWRWRDLPAACTTAGGAASCLVPGAHGTFHASAVAVAAGRPLVVSGGIDGAVRVWAVSELKLPTGVPAAPKLARALALTEVVDGLHRLDPATGALPVLPRQVRTLSLSRQAVYGITASGNGLVFAVLRTTSSRQLDVAKNVMIHGRVLGGTVHLLTPYSMAAEAAEVAEAPPPRPPPCSRVRLPSPGLLAAQLLFQTPTAACLWDVHAMALRAGLVAAAELPPVPEDAWTEAGEATAVDDAAVLEQVQGTEEGGGNADDGDGGAVGGGGAAIDLGRARLAALVRRDSEERRRAKLTTRLQHLTTTALMLSFLERYTAPLEAPYLTAAGRCPVDTNHDGGAAATTPCLFTAMRGALAWGWCGLRCANSLRRMALSYAAARADPPGASPNDQLADVDAGVVAVLLRAGGAAAAAVSAPTVLLRCREATARNEAELLQAHIWRTLSYGIEYCTHMPYGGEGDGGVTAAAGPALHRLLMSDWVARNIHQPQLRCSDLLLVVSKVYVAAGEMPPMEFAPPARERVSFSPLPIALSPPTGAADSCSGGMLESAAVAECHCPGVDTEAGAGSGGATAADTVATAAAASGGPAAAPVAAPGPPGSGPGSGGGSGSWVLSVPRCGATLAVCEAPGVWSCVVCSRRYALAPTRRPLKPAGPPVPFCLYCGVRLSDRAGGDMFIRQPSLPGSGEVTV